MEAGKIKKAVFVVTIIFLFYVSSMGDELYVPSKEYPTIQAAIDDANDGDEIIVSPGTYRENITFLGNDIVLRSTNPEDEDVVAATVIEGEGSDPFDRSPVVTFAGTESEQCRLSGFTITNGGGTNMGGGILGDGTLATIENNIIYGNQASTGMFPSNGYGGGLYECDGLIQYNTIYENQAVCDTGAARGGGLYGCDGVIQHNIIYNNSATGFGGHLGGGLCNCQGTIENNTIFGNEAHYGGGLYDCNGTVRNCIVWGNTDDQLYECYADVTYSDIEGGWAGTGNIDNDPCFADTGAGDFHLKSQGGRWDPDTQSWVIDAETSPCIDAGDWATPVGFEPFPNGGRRNMGAYGGRARAGKSHFGKPHCKTIIAGDINGDCKVDFVDLAIMALHWLEEH